ncbi:winged helix-turn-helix domain-containing protein [Patescibacteria group bacterium]|nr:winged helix-turn-helix domain-containing protein [Patescibacteria group bacterium]MBU2219631.1 winged helix-turn-helix domain-containing protein [Patescibacteria group bacterium]MBU2264715.1 winged helix-turn-helix domain-containing protein [Patescibacteria group bacterium]
MLKEEKSFHQLERIVRGFSNHRRIQILKLLKRSPELSVVEISGRLKINFKTASEHLRRLAISGLVLKRNDNQNVRHKVSERGEQVLKFLRILE